MIQDYHSRFPTVHRRCGLLREASFMMLNESTVPHVAEDLIRFLHHQYFFC